MTTRTGYLKWALLAMATAALAGMLLARRSAGPRTAIGHPTGAEPTETARPAPPPPAPNSVDASQPLAVAAAVAVALFRSDGTGPGPGPAAGLLSAHAAGVVSDLLSHDGRRALASVAAVDLLEPRAAPVVVQVEVDRWWLDAGTTVADPTSHVVVLTLLWSHPPDRWLVDDAAVLS